MIDRFVTLVTGSRHYADEPYLTKVLTSLYLSRREPLFVVVGDCPTGADSFTRTWCKTVGVDFRVYTAYWRIHGRRAGPIRNREMVDIERPDLCLAFFQPGSVNAGTKDCANYAESKGVRTIRFE